MFADRKSQMLVLVSALFLKGSCSPDRGIKGDISQVAICWSSLDVTSATGFCFRLGSAAAAAALLSVDGRFDLVWVYGVTDRYRISAFPPGRAGAFEDISCASISGNFQLG